MSKLKIKPRKFKAKFADIPNLADAVFVGDHKMPGWVLIAANTKGRECVEALFPQAHIVRRDAGPGFPADWQVFKINVPDVVSQAGSEQVAGHNWRQKSRRRRARGARLPSRPCRDAPRRTLCAPAKRKMGNLQAAREQLDHRHLRRVGRCAGCDEVEKVSRSGLRAPSKTTGDC
jgi:hypothetical protein